MTHSALNYDPTRRYDFTIEDVEYRRDGDQSWLAMMYLPQGPGPFPALVDIHGSAWNNGDGTNNPAIAAGLAASGVVVASIDFRCGGQYPYPSSLADINYATRWLKLHAADFKADATTVGGLGSPAVDTSFCSALCGPSTPATPPCRSPEPAASMAPWLMPSPAGASWIPTAAISWHRSEATRN